jgi:lysophospholipase L1-like esterase
VSAAPDRPSAKKRAVFFLIASSLSVCLFLAIVEVGARVITARLGPPKRGQELDLLMPNPRGTGSYRLKPNVDFTTKAGGRTVRIRTNRHGMHWREVEIEKTDRRRRIAFLGDSFTFGSWADSYEKSFVGVFEDNVSCERWEVLNFGVGGYGLGDMELLLTEEVIGFSPSYVVAVVFAGNDFRDTFLGIDKERIENGVAHLKNTVVRTRVPSELLVEDTTVSLACARQSPILRVMDELVSFRMLSPYLGLENLCVDFAVNRNFTAFSFWSQHPYPEEAKQAKDMVIAALERMGSFLADRRARLAIAVLPTYEQVHAREAAGQDYDIFLPQAYLQVYARERDIPYIDFLPILRAHVQSTNERLFLKSDTHLNNRGHEIVGRNLAEWFRCCVRDRARLIRKNTDEQKTEVLDRSR